MAASWGDMYMHEAYVSAYVTGGYTILLRLIAFQKLVLIIPMIQLVFHQFGFSWRHVQTSGW